MLSTLDDVASLLKAIDVPAQRLHAQVASSHGAHAFVIEMAHPDATHAWHRLRQRVEQTRHYPLLVIDWGGGDDFFSRYWYEGEQTAGLVPGVEPEAILASVPSADIAAFLRQHADKDRDALDVAIDHQCARTHSRFGSCPTPQDVMALVDAGDIQTPLDLERWLFGWELQTFGAVDTLLPEDTSYVDWYDPHTEAATLLLLPVQGGWNTLAYVHWYGALTGGTPLAIALLKQWHQTYGAELVCHYGTMLQLEVARKPTTPAAAFQLAWEQTAIAECTTILPGISVREHARTLLAVPRWFLHERP